MIIEDKHELALNSRKIHPEPTVSIVIPHPVPCLEIRAGRVGILGSSGIRTGINKQPQRGMLRIGFHGLEIDEQAESFHGGRDKALLHYDFAHYAVWRSELPECGDRLVAGGFGENLVAEGWSEQNVCIGDIVRFGTCILEVSEPRQPCFKLNHRFGVENMSHRTQSSGRTGWYYRVLETGEATPGDVLEIVDRPNPEWSIHDIQRHLYGDLNDNEAAERLATLNSLSAGFRRLFRARIENGQREDWGDRLWNGPLANGSRNWIAMTVDEIVQDRGATRRIRLKPASGETLPLYEAGAHIELKVENALSRCYSLTRLPAGNVYEIAVQQVPDGRVSGYIHEALAVGELVSVAEPRNLFPLAETAGRHVFIAGGIGITPFLSMIEAVLAQGSSWELHYCVRSLSEAPLLDRIASLPGGCVTIHTSDGSSGIGRFDMAAYCRDIRPEEHLYCCGPDRLMEGFGEAVAHWPSDQVHREVFVAPGLARAKPFVVTVEPEGRAISVGAAESLATALQRAGLPVPVSCGVGMCGTCEVVHCGGEIDHRDHVLGDEARASRMMSCVSRAKGDSICIRMSL